MCYYETIWEQRNKFIIFIFLCILLLYAFIPFSFFDFIHINDLHVSDCDNPLKTPKSCGTVTFREKMSFHSDKID